MDTGLDEWRLENPREASQLQIPWFKFYLGTQTVLADTQLQYNGGLLICSFLGFYVNFLFNAVNTIDLCQNIPILAKVIESITSQFGQVFGCMFLGFFLQYAFVALSFMVFGKGYGFADMDTAGCATLIECLMGHFDYGFRSAPVWHDPMLDSARFLFDYLYNLLIILIMASIISGIIIDSFSELKEKQEEVVDAMTSSCFICALSQAELERARVKFKGHILEDHYMWSYARFLLYLEVTDKSELNGPESYVKKLVSENNMGFFPIGRCIDIESSDMGEEHLEREVRVKDMEDLNKMITKMTTNTGDIKRQEGSFKVELKELREAMTSSATKISQLQTLMASDAETGKKKKKGK